MNIKAINSIKNTQIRKMNFTSSPEKNTEETKEKNNNNTLLLGSLAALAVGSGIYYLVTRGKSPEKTVQKTPEIIEEAIQKVPEIVEETTNSIVKETNKIINESILKLQELFKSGKTNNDVFIPKNNRDICIVTSKIDTENGYTVSSKVYKEKEFKYNPETDTIDATPISSRTLKRNKKTHLGEAELINQSGTKTTIVNSEYKHDLYPNSIKTSTTITNPNVNEKYTKTTLRNNDKDELYSIEVISSDGPEIHSKEIRNGEEWITSPKFEEVKQNLFAKFQ